MKVEEVICCSFPNWYKKFKDVTIPSIILPIPSEVVNYLQENGTLVLPEGSHEAVYDRRKTSDSDSTLDWEDESKESEIAIAPNFEGFSSKILDGIRNLGGTAFPKLNWSSPKDASWISFNKSLQCHCPADVYLLLKSSDFVSHDLTCPFKDCDDKASAEPMTDYWLILRKWIEINPSDEFRCFVRNRQLIGVSQRDISQYYPSINAQRDCILEDIMLFWDQYIRNYFPSMSYVFDIHRPADGIITLIDFGPFGPTTDALMYTWQELEIDKCLNGDTWSPNQVNSDRLTEPQDEEPDPEMRYITNATGVQPSPYMRYGLPVDVVDLSTGQDLSKLTDFLKMRIQKEDDASSSSEDDEEDLNRVNRCSLNSSFISNLS